MSVAMTADAVIERRKTVTRRVGWLMLRPGDTLTLCRKVQGRRKGEPLERLAEVEVVRVDREHLSNLTHFPDYGAREVGLEGFPGMDPARFVLDYFVDAQGMDPDDLVTRIEWAYLCSQCDDGERAVEHGMCGSCLHNAYRSGWSPGTVLAEA